jgi:hypothetical protein
MDRKNRKRIQYSEHEAARRLGVSVAQLRSLVRNQFETDEEVPTAVFHATDLVVLKILSARPENVASGG